MLANSPNHDSVSRVVIEESPFIVPSQFSKHISNKKFIRFNGCAARYYDPLTTSTSELIVTARLYDGTEVTISPKLIMLHSDFVQLQLDSATDNTDSFVCFCNRGDEWREFPFIRPKYEFKFWFTYMNQEVFFNNAYVDFIIELEFFV